MMILMEILIRQQPLLTFRTAMIKFQSILIDHKELLPIVLEHFGSILSDYLSMMENGCIKVLIEISINGLYIL